MTHPVLDRQQVRDLYEELGCDYDIMKIACSLGGEAFHFFSVRDSYELLDRISPEEFVKDEQMPYWAEIWPSSLALSRFIIEELDLRDKPVIEIGAGVGVVSIAAARKGGKVLSTDYSEEALRFIALNARANNVELQCSQLDWRCIRISKQFDLLFAADVLYERVNLLPIIHAIDRLLAPGGSAWIADPRRRLTEQFLDLAFENGFSVSSFARSFELNGHVTQVNIYRISRSLSGE
ncbi:Methyltransferase type 12 [Prosthecochloris aestuarii DSM 271]|uniref:Methyltransferase type 12 n=1 Tax=Prosthecochloris aestuarii (strain DSM 271 / SK 413) TaxID=290512 RepID=B4S5H4_PROA2|nr:methyltransferase domain-containing protein [Prosthecochloris aestuarii]ACF45571.1 Methyltransferase type 12 [Prosthecochloris aestuarii DSM 271]